MSNELKKMTAKDGESKDLIAENVDKLKQLFPEIVTEGRIDFDTLKEVLGDFSDDRPERYSFTWNGKTEARKLAMTPSKGTLRPAPEESVNWDSTQNLFIEGDNLEVLKLLQRSYHKKVKMIFIDPPYNTGNDFVYNDNFKDNLSNYLKLTGQKDGEGNKITSNPETSGRYHTDWLNMMYPRLKLARELLRKDGMIFISIDDNELSNLKKMCDEIFGEENFKTYFIWKKKSTTSNVLGAEVSSLNDYIVCYGKSSDAKIKPRITKSSSRSYPYTDEEGDYRLSVIEKKDSGDYRRDSMKFEILETKPREGKRWQIGEATARDLENKGRFILGEDGIIRLKTYDFEDEDSTSAQPNILDSHGNTENASKYVNEELLNGSEIFNNPKPYELIKHLIDISCDNEDLVLDFFAGSCSTAEAVLRTKDSLNCRYIMVQLPEPTEKDGEAFKAGFKNIADIGKNRIRQVIKKLINNQGYSQDTTGFKVFKLDASNIKPWDPTFEDIQLSLEDSIENIKSDRSEEDVIYEILLKYGLDLTLPIEEKTIAGAKVYVGGAGALILCLSDNITTEVVEGIAKLKDDLNPEFMRVVFRDSGFKDDVIKTNAVQILKQQGIEDMRSI
jgi:adenine-specific DNA-methyltransferase